MSMTAEGAAASKLGWGLSSRREEARRWRLRRGRGACVGRRVVEEVRVGGRVHGRGGILKRK